DSQQGAWLASADTGPLPPQLAAAAPFARTPLAALEWMPKLRAYPAPAPRMAFSPRELLVEDQRTTATGRMVRGRLVSARGGALGGRRIVELGGGLKAPATYRVGASSAARTHGNIGRRTGSPYESLPA